MLLATADLLQRESITLRCSLECDPRRAIDLLLERYSKGIIRLTHSPPLMSRWCGDYIRHLEKDNFKHYYGDVLGLMLDNLNSAILERAVSDACTVMRVQPRTGYLCPSLTKGLGRIKGFATYIEKEVIPWIKSLKSAREGIALLPSICGRQDDFHLYQVELTFQSWPSSTSRSNPWFS